MIESVQLRRLRPTDAERLYEAVRASHAELARWMGWCHADYSLQESIDWAAGQDAAWQEDREWSFVIVDRDDRILGACGMHRIDLRNNIAEAGYWVRSCVAGRGIATTAMTQLAEWARSEKQIHRIEIIIAVENHASQRVAEKVGAIREGRLRDRLLVHGERMDCFLYALIRQS